MFKIGAFNSAIAASSVCGFRNIGFRAWVLRIRELGWRGVGFEVWDARP